MDFNLSDEQKMMRDMVHDFAKKEIWPLAEKIDDEDKFPPGMFKRMGELGILGVPIPEEYGGVGCDVLTQTIVIEELSRFSPSVALSFGAHANLCMYNILHNGSDEQKNMYLPRLAAGEIIGCLGLTEPNAGSDAVSIRTTAVKSGGEYILNGTKTFITNAPMADLAIIYAKTDPAAGPRGITAFLVEKSFPGYSASKKIKKMGHRGSPTGEIVMEDCRVPARNILGAENKGVAVMMSGLDVERAFFAGEAIGIAQGAFDLSLQYSREREQFGKPISSFQLIQAKLADMYADIEAGRSLCYKAAKLAGEAKRGGKGTEINRLAAASLLFNARMCNRVADEALQIHGGYGYTLEYPVNRFYRDAKLMTIGAGTTEIRQLIIARDLLAD